MSTYPEKKSQCLFFKRLASCFLFATVILISVNPLFAANKVFEADVLKVIDGDTIRLKDGRLIRYLGIDAPDLKRKINDVWTYAPQPFAEEAAKLNKELVEGKRVLIALDPTLKEHDKYGRLLAFVYIDKIMVNEELLKRGLARTDIPSLFMKHRIRFWSLEEIAWTGKNGLWAGVEKKE
ncbi:MAG: thermonuclease family protein [Nitrospiria bacterium]